MTIPSMTNVQTSGVQNSISEILNQSSMISNKLATGKSVLAPYEDPAGLAIGTRLEINLSVQKEALKSANQASVVLNIAYGGAKSVQNNLKRLNQLSIMALNGSAGDDDRALIDLEAQQLKLEIDCTTKSTDFNGKNLIDGSVNNNAVVAKSNGMSLKLRFKEGDQAVDKAIFDQNGNKILEVDSAGKLTFSAKLNSGSDKILDASNKEIYTYEAPTSGSPSTPGTIKSLDGSETYFTLGDNINEITEIKGSSGDVVLKYAAGKLTNNSDKELYDFNNPGDKNKAMVFQVGNGPDQKISVSFGSTDTETLGIADIKLGTSKDAEEARKLILDALDYMSKYNSEIGAYQSRFKMVAENIATSIENVDAARAQFMDADFTELSKQLSQQKATLDAAIAAQAQLIQVPQKLIRLTQFI